MKIQDMKDLISYVHEEQGGNTRHFLDLLEEYREKRTTISRNRDLSAEGKQKQFTKLTAAYEKKALELSHDLQANSHKTARQIKEAAEKLLVSEIPTVDRHKQALFDQQVEEIEAAVKFAVTPQRAKKALDKLANLADEPGLAHIVKGKIFALSDHVLELMPPANRAEMRKEIGDLYNAATKAARPEGSQEAKEIIETADAFLNSSGIAHSVEIALRQISPMTSTYIHRPEERLQALGGGE